MALIEHQSLQLWLALDLMSLKNSGWLEVDIADRYSVSIFWLPRWHDAQEQDGRVKRLSEEERQALLRQLKTKWGQLNAAFQKLPLQLDTLSKHRSKQHIEEQLLQCEADIQLLQWRPVVLVSQTSWAGRILLIAKRHDGKSIKVCWKFSTDIRWMRQQYTPFWLQSTSALNMTIINMSHM